MYDDILDRHRSILDGTDDSAGRFTQRVAWDLRASHVLIRKTSGTRCDGPGGGIDCDKVMQRTAPHAIYDIVVSAGGPENRPGWSHARNHDGTLAYGQPHRAVDPVPYDTAPEPTPVPTPTPTPAPECRYQVDPQVMLKLDFLIGRLDQIEENMDADMDVLRVEIADVRAALANGLAIEGTGTGLRWVGTQTITGIAKG